MKTTDYASYATDALGTFASTAHSAIDAYRDGGERLADLASQRWNRALRQAGPKLTPETRKNATRARKVIGGYYAQGLEASANGAETVLDTLVKAAATGIGRVAELAAARNGHRA